MTKEQTLEAIKNARNAHELQMVKIEKLIEGREVENLTAVAKTKCEFGQWLYSDNNHVKEILGEQFYTNIDDKHSKWHTEYLKIFNIFFKNQKKSFFSSLIGLHTVDSMEIDKAKLYYSELQVTTNDLLSALASSERRLAAMNESKFHY